ncbi:hypothetical protein QF021_003649 [Acidovorax delafieldii]|nr:IPTL-CTERM sorting domain-containing protein [Acidovorax delafieldii]MDR6155560.1 hypothetical protein [Acidovorax delafieldii]
MAFTLAPVVTSTTAVPTLSEWSVILLSGLMALAVFAKSRKRRN